MATKMKLTIKTLSQKVYHVEVDSDTDTVLSLKEKLFVESGSDYPINRQRLIYLGKIMEDDQPLSTYVLDPRKFIVVMNMKPTTAAGAAPAAGAAAATTAASTATAAGGASAAGSDSGASRTTGKETKAPEGGAATGSSASTATTAGGGGGAAETKKETSTDSAAKASAAAEEQAGKREEESKAKDEPSPAEASKQEEIQINILRIKEMGYSEEEAKIALEICDNNPDRAVEYLLSEIATSSMGGGGSQLRGSSGASTGTLEFLREHPTFIEMKKLLQEDPNLLPHLMQKIQASNPDLMRIISENQEEFLVLINESTDGSDGQPRELETTAAAMVDSLTPSDMDAINRLKALGYPEHLVIQAYIACERNEYQAANFLVSQTLDDDE